MKICASCKNKDSDEQCPNKSLKGLILCGKHARMKNPRLWADVNNLNDKVVCIQKLWRGYIIRKWLKLAGPGVLKRSLCHNEEELVTFETRSEIHPLDYFAFNEGDKIYWFDVRSILENSIDKIKPLNPYTREPLSIETRKRLRTIAILRDHRKLPNLHTENIKRTAEAMLNLVWTTVCQILEENGFNEVLPIDFIRLNKTQLYVFISIIIQDTTAWAAEHNKAESRRNKYIHWFKFLLKKINDIRILPLASYTTAKCLISYLNDYPDPYEICFIIMSALHRV